ncbi:Major Facilitator Superfamily protein [Marininema mesophilum]|uniref:Major Facilitator Superfamily protein n=1 Tax=Marininema mesophilum TaxID=1048340 RepID=A0A1H3ASS7_9BACL|nr:MFS transporter [Marininema mesophilum]SDX32747.1 Major Facilitator Superfamily protein [Marininema mesophilum]
MENQVSKQLHSPVDMVSTFPLLRNYKFICLWIASLFSGIAFSAYLTTESWYVVNGLKMKWAVGVVMMVTAIPRVVFMMWGGVIADRFDRVRIMFLSSGARCLLIVAMVYLLWAKGLPLLYLLLFAGVFGVLDAFFGPASQSILPQIIKKEQLLKANSFMEITRNFGVILGPIFAGVILKWGSFIASFSVSGVALMIACLFLTGIQLHKDQTTSSYREKKSTFQELKEGIHYVWATPWLRTLMLIALLTNLLLQGPLQGGIPLMVKYQLHGDALDLSFLEGSIAGGMIGGALLIGWLNFRRRRMLISIILIMFLGVAIAIFSVIMETWQGMIVLAFGGVAISMSNTIIITLFQERVDKEKIGRVMSLVVTAAMGFIPLSHGLVSLILSMGVSISAILFCSSTLMILYNGLMLMTARVIRETD